MREADYQLFKKKLLATFVKGDPKSPFSIATPPRCRGGCYSIPWIAPLHPWCVSYNPKGIKYHFLSLWYTSTRDWSPPNLQDQTLIRPINYEYVKLTTLVKDDPKTPFSIATTPRCKERALLHSLDCSTLLLICYLIVLLSKVASSTIFWVFGMTRAVIKLKFFYKIESQVLIFEGFFSRFVFK